MKANEKYELLVRENEQLIKSLKEEVASIKLRCFRLTMVGFFGHGDNNELNIITSSFANRTMKSLILLCETKRTI